MSEKKETKLPIEERANGLIRPIEKVEKPVEMPAPVKRKPGRPPKNKTAGNVAPKNTTKKRQTKGNGTKEMAGGKEAVAVTTQEEDEDVTGPTLSKEEIKKRYDEQRERENAGGWSGAVDRDDLSSMIAEEGAKRIKKDRERANRR